jgi:hypothetical protein
VFSERVSLEKFSSPSLKLDHERMWSCIDLMSDVKVLFSDLLLKDVMISQSRLFFFVSIVEYFVTNRYLKKDKIKVAIVLLEEKACVWFNIFTRNCESEGLGLQG